MSSSQASEALKQYLVTDPKRGQILDVPEGKYKGWIPRVLYEWELDELYLPFMKLLSFPVGGTALGKLVQMKVFSAKGNHLTKLPVSFKQCEDLVSLNLGYNYFEEVPQCIFKLRKLEDLDMRENDILTLSPDVGYLQNLKILNLSGNILETVPHELSKCKKLTHLDISRKFYPKGGFTTIPEGICDLPALQYLTVNWHQVGTIPDEIGRLCKLERLTLKGNYLRYISHNICNCSSLHTLDLSGSLKLCSAMPAGIFCLENLKCLNLSGNYFTEIASEICQLRKLEVLLIVRNALLRLPEELFKLKSLKELDLSDNYLQSIPSSIKRLHHLRRLDLTHNQLTVLPNELCDCKHLEELLLALNKLQSIPEKIYKLKKLGDLNLCCNSLKQLPLFIDRIESLEKTGRLFLHDNYLTRPPQEICDQGVSPLYKYLKELRISEAKHRRKMILIGAVKAGKTSLRNALVLGQSKLTAEHERTWVLERHLWEPEPVLRVQILDFGGHHIYSAAHQMFLTPEALHVIVFDFSNYRAEEYDNRMGNWICAVMDRAPGAAIVIVGTHADLCTQEQIDEITSDILEHAHSDENMKLNALKVEMGKCYKCLEAEQARESGKFADLDVQRMQEKVNRLERTLVTRVRLPNRIHVVSCADDLTGVDVFRDELISELKATDEKPLPKSWYKFLAEIQKNCEKVLTWSQALEIFEEVMKSMKQSMIGLEGSAESSLNLVLKYLHATGEIVWYHENPKLREMVFHRPETLVEMLRAIFRHDFREVVNFSEDYGSMVGLTKKRFDLFKEEFLGKGLMAVELLQFTLLHFELSVDRLDTFMSMMLKFDLCFEVPKTKTSPSLMGSEKILQFPWFLPQEEPSNLSTLWPKYPLANAVELSFELHFPSKGPPNFFEKLSVRLQNHVFDRTDWKHGTFARKNKCSMLVTLRRNIVSVSVRGYGSELPEIWWLLLQTRSDMMFLLQEWPFIRIDQYLLCAHCILCHNEEPHMYPGEVLEITCEQGFYNLHCPLSEEGCLIPACFVYPLDSEFHEDLPNHIIAVTDFLQKQDDCVDGIVGILSDQGLSYIAANLGIEWILVVIQLGLSQQHTEQIQMDNPNNTYKQILTALVKWRDTQPGDYNDKMDVLFTVLKENNRIDLVALLEEKYRL